MPLSTLQLPPFLDNHLRWVVAVLIIAGGLGVAGFGDLLRVSFMRIWAISSVCFQESIRRRVLWITPLAIVGVVITVQLLHPDDEQDAVRQTIKYSLFATAMVVFMATILLACTNLPKEIENRVIFTIVTKPATRLEIILGKVVGFARVSATILLIMGLFTLGYTEFRAHQLRNDAAERLATLSPSDASRPSLEHHVQNGLLSAHEYAGPIGYEQFADVPNPQSPVRWMNGNEDQSANVLFELPPEIFPEPGTGQNNEGLVIRANILVQYEDERMYEHWHPTPYLGAIPDRALFKRFSLHRHETPTVQFDLLAPDHLNLIGSTELPERGTVVIRPLPQAQALLPDAPHPDLLVVPPGLLDRFAKLPPQNRRVFVRVVGMGWLRYGIMRDSIHLFSPRLEKLHPGKGELQRVKDADGKIPWPEFRGREIPAGQQMRAGRTAASAQVAIFQFRGVGLDPNTHAGAAGGQIAFEFRGGIEGSSDSANSGKETLTQLVIDTVNTRTGQTAGPIALGMESNRTAFFNLPAASLAGGDFDLRLRCIGSGHYLVLQSNPLQLVTASEPFTFNLFKSLLVMWLMSLLVVIVSICCSTFVSWPIAIVLTIVVLLGHWGAEQISDTNAAGLGAQMARDLGLRDPAEAKVVSEGIDRLSALLNAVSKVLPDISQFAATESVERGMVLPARVVADSLKIIAAFGVPMTVLAYLFFKRKEVAP